MRKKLLDLRVIILSTIFLIIQSCSSTYRSKDLEGVYKQDESKNIEFHLQGNKFALLDVNKNEHQPLYKCCDTIAYGIWKTEGDGFVSLSSPEDLGEFVDLRVEESKKDLPKNNVVFVIDNPIESHYQKFEEDYRELSYNINISTGIDFIERKAESNTVETKIEGDITEFEITILVKSDIPLRESLREVYTLPYKVKNPKSNYFRVSIPELTYGFLSYKRLKDDYVKIISENKLLWDGKEYSKN